MRILESSPRRYDLGIRLMTLGRLDRVYDRLVLNIEKGQRVLDIGCGTGALTLKVAEKGANVKGIDLNPEMLKLARERAAEADLSQKVDLVEMGVAEMGNEKGDSYDIVMSGLCFSELSDDESEFTLREVMRILKPGGFLLIADETTPNTIGKRLVNGIVRFPLVIVTFLLTQTTTHAVKDLAQKVNGAGFQLSSVRLNRMGNFIELVAQKPGNS